jgi:hypothetical protein
MSARLELKGVDELRAQLRRLPQHLTDEASDIITSTAHELRTEVQNAYPRGPTGNLLRMVSVIKTTSALMASALVRNRAPHAAIFEYGTQTRQTALGYNRGRMPPGRVFVPRAISARRRMWDRLKAMLVREGLTVTGDAG